MKLPFPKIYWMPSHFIVAFTCLLLFQDQENLPVTS